MTVQHLDLFSGIGGFALAAEWAGFETAMFCEIDPFCREVLGKHWPHVPIHDDIRTLTADVVGQPIDLITGGFPCQPFSVAGKRRGSDDDRHLWPEMARLIGECRPRWVLGENVAGFVNVALDDCLTDLESLGYEAWPVVVPACGVGAWHRRERVWIVANAGRELLQGVGVTTPVPRATDRGEGATDSDTSDGGIRRRRSSGRAGFPTQLREVVPDTVRGGQPQPQGGIRAQRGRAINGGQTIAADASCELPHGTRRARGRWSELADGGQWSIEPDVGRLAHGIPRRVDRLRSLGNAIVPQVAYVILSAMLETEAA